MLHGICYIKYFKIKKSCLKFVFETAFLIILCFVNVLFTLTKQKVF
jgi:hypothetical protein